MFTTTLVSITVVSISIQSRLDSILYHLYPFERPSWPLENGTTRTPNHTAIHFNSIYLQNANCDVVSPTQKFKHYTLQFKANAIGIKEILFSLDKRWQRALDLRLFRCFVCLKIFWTKVMNYHRSQTFIVVPYPHFLLMITNGSSGAQRKGWGPCWSG